MSELRICSVHQLIDNDTSLRDCTWCSMCKAWICKADLNRWDRRAKAAVKKPKLSGQSSGCSGCGK